MSREYLKKASRTSSTDASDVQETVRAILDEIEAGGDEAAMKYAAKFDKYEGAVILGKEDIAAASAKVSPACGPISNLPPRMSAVLRRRRNPR